MSSLPPNVHVSQHPALRSKLSQLRSKSADARAVKSLINDIALILSCEALATSLQAVDGPKDVSPIGYEYTTTTVSPSTMCIVPILRSGLGMVEGMASAYLSLYFIKCSSCIAVQTILPDPVPVHHLGMYREPTTLDPVEYYNNLPHHIPSADSSSASPASSLAIVVDPVIATGGTCAAAISTLREWGAQRILVLAVIGAEEGVRTVAQEWPENTDIWVAGIDGELTKEGMLKPGLGDVGDRLFLTIGK